MVAEPHNDVATKEWTIVAMVLCSLYVDKRPQTSNDVVDFIIIHLYGDLIELGYDPDNDPKWIRTVKSLMAIKQYIERVNEPDKKVCKYQLIEKKIGEVRNILLKHTENHKLNKLVLDQNYENSTSSVEATTTAPPVTPKKRGRKPKRKLDENDPVAPVQETYIEPAVQSPPDEPRAKRMKLFEEFHGSTLDRPRVDKDDDADYTPPAYENTRRTRAKTLAPEGTSSNHREPRYLKASESPPANQTPKVKVNLVVPHNSDSTVVVKRGRGRPRKIL